MHIVFNKILFWEIMMKSFILYSISIFIFFSAQSNAALISGLGGEVVYDTDRDITWISNANLATTNSFGLAYDSNLGAHPSDINTNNYTGLINSDGRMNWSGAMFWIDGMNSENYLGHNDWRLPTALLPDGSECGGFCTESELGHLFYHEWGGSLSSGDSDLALFSNVMPSAFWTSTVSELSSNHVTDFTFRIGAQTDIFKHSNIFALAVRDGNVSTPSTPSAPSVPSVPSLPATPAPSAVPVPGAVWLFGSGVIGLFGIRKKRLIASSLKA
jgi:hypothetical protein